MSTVALTGDDAFGSTYSGFSAPSLNNRGHVAFSAEFDGNDDDQGLVTVGPGGEATLVVRDERPLPGIGGDVTAYHIPTVLTLDGASFRASFSGSGGSGGTAIVSHRGPDQYDLVAQTGASPNVPGADYEIDFFAQTQVATPDGTTVFMATLTGPTTARFNDFAVFRHTPDKGLEVVVREGDLAPTGDLSSHYGFSIPARLLWYPSVSHRGTVAFTAELVGSDPSDSRQGVFVHPEARDARIAASTGDPLPGAADGAALDAFSVPTINRDDTTAFYAGLTGPSVNSSNEYALLTSDSSGETNTVLRSGDPLPALGPDVNVAFRYTVLSNFDSTPSTLAMNGGGKLALITPLTGAGVDDSNNFALLTFDGEEDPQVVIQKGDDAPDGEPGMTITSVGGIALNNRGQAVFHTWRSDNSRAIYAQDHAGEIQLIAATGGVLDVSDDPLQPDPRTIQSLAFVGSTGNEDGRPSAFNDRGELVFWAEFTDGSSGVFVSTRVAVPEPHAVAMAAALVVLGSLRSRR